MANEDPEPRADAAEPRAAVIDVKPIEAASPSAPAQSRKRDWLAVIVGAASLAAIIAYVSWRTDEAQQAFDELKSQHAALRARIEAQDKGGAAPSGADSAAVTSRLAALEQRKLPEALSPEAGAALAARISALEQRQPSASFSQEAGAALANRLNAAENVVKALIEAANRAQQHEGRLAALESAPRPEVPPPVNLAPLEARLAALEQKLLAVETALAAPKTDLRATQTAEAAISRADSAALPVVAQAIRGALERGEPFVTELAAARALGAEAAQLDALAPLEGGAPTTRALTQAFRAVSRAALDAAAQKPENAGMMDQLSNAAQRLVRVRPTGEAAGEDATALLARIEAALDRGAVSDALAVWNRLPEGARKASQTWAADARRRAAADTAAQAMLTGAIADIARKRSAP